MTCLDVILQPLGGHRVGGNAAIEHHMRLHDLPPRLVGNADHRALGNVTMREQAPPRPRGRRCCSRRK
jgi:hypothetical protein